MIKDQPDSFDESVYSALKEEARRALEAGLSKDEVDEIVAQLVQNIIDGTIPNLVERLVQDAPRMLREHTRLKRGFERRLRKFWGESIDLFYMVAVCAEELGSEFNERRRLELGDTQDYAFEALVRIHARTCRTSMEIYHLISGGFPMGALARSRTLHELAVIGMVIAEYDGKSGCEDLAERFIHHVNISSHKDAVTYQVHHEALSRAPFSEEEIFALKEKRDDLLDRYGPLYIKDYGWATGVHGGREPKFIDLERYANVAHLRSHYKWASHEIHADAKGLALNTNKRGNKSYLLTGPVNFGLAEPGHMALISLHQATVSLLLYNGPPSLGDLVALGAIQQLVDKAGEALLKSAIAVAEAEENFQREAESLEDLGTQSSGLLRARSEEI